MKTVDEFFHWLGMCHDTGTPEGVGPVLPGDTLTGYLAGVAEIALTMGPAKYIFTSQQLLLLRLHWLWA